MNDSGKVLLGVLAGAAAGALLGVLLAPERGSDTRQRLVKLGDDYAGDITGKIKDLRDSITEKIDSFREDNSELVEKGKSMMNKSGMGSTGNKSGGNTGSGYSSGSQGGSHGSQNL